jgi:hypothetical protein
VVVTYLDTWHFYFCTRFLDDSGGFKKCIMHSVDASLWATAVDDVS